MKATDEQRPATTDVPMQADEKRVTVHRSSPDRAVFVENGNSDGWISTDYTVDLIQ